MVNIVAIIATLLAVGGTILVSIGASLPHFVDVYIIQFTSQIDDSEPVAGVGVYNSQYDASVLSAEIIAASGVPEGAFETKTLEFPLLFPAQENFVADVLPVTPELAVGIDVALNAQGAISTPLINNINAVEALEFESCDQYIPEALTSVGSLFGTLQFQTLPLVVSAIDQNLLLGINEAKVGAIGLLLVSGENNPVDAFVSGALASVLAALQAVPGCEAVLASTPFAASAGVAQCLAGAFQQAGAAAPVTTPASKSILSQLAEYTSSAEAQTECALPITVQECYDGILANVALFDPSATTLNSDLAFDTTRVVTGCTLLTLVIAGQNQTCDSAAIFHYLSAETQLLLEVNRTEAAGGLALYLTAANSFSDLVGIDRDTVLATNATEQLVSTDFVFPTLFTDTYTPCTYLVLFEAATKTDLSTVTPPTVCEFKDYFVGAFELLVATDNSLAAALGDIAELYTACAAATNNTFVGRCPGVFALGILDGAYGGDITASEEFQTTGNATLAGIAQCDDDVVDNEKVSQAQVALIVALVFYGLTTLGGISGLVLPKAATFVFAFTGIFAILAGILTIAALLIVQSAPVYEGVGIEPNEGVAPEDAEFEPFFENGEVVLMALISAVALLLSGLLFFAGSFVAHRANVAGVSTAEVVEVDEKKEKKVDDTDIVPGTNVAI